MKKIGYRIYKAFTDNYGNITHKTLIGFAKTMQGVRAFHVSEGVSISEVIEKVYSK